MEWFLMIAGFMLASYAIVANDAIQTLGTFLSSNSKRPWWVLWLYSTAILVAVLLWGWFTHGGDPSYGRLDTIAHPEHFTWLYVLPPVVLLVLTRFGMPVSTTFLVLTVFSPESLRSMVDKSLLGYGVAFGVAVVVYMAIARLVSARLIETSNEPPSRFWTGLQWISTGFLWAQWLIQDLANIFVYLPRPLGGGLLVGSLVLMMSLHAWIFYKAGGAIQKIVTSKTNTGDIRSATLIDFMFALVLLFFKELSSIPMSTTWVFLGLLGGRELALTLRLQVRTAQNAGWIITRDVVKAATGLAVSVALALALPWLTALTR
ncbi:MAG: hypothetical protein KDK70_03310 [Myxococcales bacterium]|nr:hypothetical protein [Myxococcales bacterium]